MLIDWVTVCAQIVNFFVLVWLLHRFLFKPVLKVVEERDKKIKAELEGAARQKEAAFQEKQALLQERETFQRQKNSVLSQAIADAQREKESLLRQAKQEYESLHSSLQGKAQKEREALFSEMKKEIGEEVFSTAQKALQDIAHENIEEKIIETFVRKLKNIRPEEKETILSDTKNFSLPIDIKTSFDLPLDTHLFLEKELRGVFGNDLSLVFKRDPSLICGIELATSGHKVEWNLSRYLLQLERLV